MNAVFLTFTFCMVQCVILILHRLAKTASLENNNDFKKDISTAQPSHVKTAIFAPGLKLYFFFKTSSVPNISAWPLCSYKYDKISQLKRLLFII